MHNKNGHTDIRTLWGIYCEMPSRNEDGDDDAAAAAVAYAIITITGWWKEQMKCIQNESSG